MTESFGTIKIKVNDRLKESGMSKNELCYKAQVQRTQLNRFCSGQVTRLDTDVLARLCTALNCGIGDLLEFVPSPEQTK